MRTPEKRGPIGPDQQAWFAAGLLFISGLIIQIHPWFQPGKIDIAAQVTTLAATVAGALSTLLALIVTAILVVAQLSSQYSHRMAGNFFGGFTRVYVSYLVLAILVSLSVVIWPTVGGAKVALMAAIIALGLLFPYAVSFRQWLSPAYLVKKLIEETNRVLSNENPEAIAYGNLTSTPITAEPPAEIIIIMEILTNLIERGDYTLFGECFLQFQDGALIPEKPKIDQGPAETVAWHKTEGSLEWLCRDWMDKPHAIREIIFVLGYLGMQALLRGYANVAWAVTRMLGDMWSRDRQNARIVEPLVLTLGAIVKTALDHQVWSFSERAIETFSPIAVAARTGDTGAAGTAGSVVNVMLRPERTIPDAKANKAFRAMLTAFKNASRT